MNQSLMPLLVVASSLVPGIVIFFLAERHVRLRTALNLAGALAKLALVGAMLWGVSQGRAYELRHEVLPGMDLVLRADALALLFVTLSALLWLLTTLYAIGYLEGSPRRSRFFGFFSLCVTATMGIAMAGNLFTFFVFYELLTLATYPLVVHRGTEAALRAGHIYLGYTLAGGALLLVAIVWLASLTGPVDFRPGGVLADLDVGHAAALQAIFLMLMLGLGVKAALVPLHGWLPRAMVAPAPVSALLHAVAVVKAGAFGIVRVVYEVYGAEFAQTLGLLLPLAAVAALTIVWGSLRALAQVELKKRLAYSTVSQVSYIVLGVALFGPIGAIGGLVHLVHQGIMKITLFFCAGNFAETLGAHRIDELDGAGRRMPYTTMAFTIAALGMIGLPPTAGYVSKSYLEQGAHAAGMPWAAWVLVASGVLNAAYFLPILYRAWVRRPAEPRLLANAESRSLANAESHDRRDAPLLLLVPALLTAGLTLAVGVFADMAWTPLEWARLIAGREYGHFGAGR